jgi:hypothetical protein
VHCRGGKGRTSTVVGCLIDGGPDYESAISRIAELRAGTCKAVDACRSRRDSTGCFESAPRGARRVEPDYHDDGGASSLNSIVGVCLSLAFVFPRRLGMVVTVVDPAEVGNQEPPATGQPVERATHHAQARAGTHCRTIARCPIVIKNSVFRYGETPFNLLEASAHLLHHFLHVPRYGGIAPR